MMSDREKRPETAHRTPAAPACPIADESHAQWDRRTLLSGAMALGSGVAMARAAESAPLRNRIPLGGDPWRIDTHQHILPPPYVAALGRRGMSAWGAFPWSEDGALEMMDKNAIATGILSLSTPGVNLGDNAEARDLAKRVNEIQADLVRRRPDRFGMFACLPLPDVEGAVEAARYAYDALATDGVILLANSRGTYVGDPLFDPLMEELDRRSALVFIHPGSLPGPPVKGIHPSIADFLLDTTRAAINLVSHGIPRRFPRLKIILSHAGGFLPYGAYRIAALSSSVDPTVDRDAMFADLRTFYFDTALSGTPTALPSLLAFAKPGHVLFGSDWPYCSTKTVASFTESLDNFDPSNTPLHAAINRKNAEHLLPRLKAE